MTHIVLKTLRATSEYRVNLKIRLPHPPTNRNWKQIRNSNMKTNQIKQIYCHRDLDILRSRLKKSLSDVVIDLFFDSNSLLYTVHQLKGIPQPDVHVSPGRYKTSVCVLGACRCVICCLELYNIHVGKLYISYQMSLVHSTRMRTCLYCIKNV